MSGDRDELLDAIEVLTLPNRSRILQTKNGISCISPYGPGSLLEQLRKGIAGNTGHHASGSDGATRLPLDVGALALNAEVQQEVGRWYVRDAHLPPLPAIDDTLRAWHRVILNRRRRDGDTGDIERTAVRRLVAWANRIQSMFNPVQRLELTQLVPEPLYNPITGEPRTFADGSPHVRFRQQPAACPRCGERTAHDPTTGDQITALVLEYRLGADDGVLHGAEASCRFCEAEWHGERGVRELRWMLDHPGAFLPEDGVLD